ncbi:hypothetical protein AO068_15240 [Pseudomonas sp. ICMP 3272]|nr:hypothetical protein AO068_15240 [Pseudomonas sp. ICMP 3272]KTC51788.1 hypothetical protein AO258_16030 [Pseudomonas syringae ICMP 19498]
MSDDRAIELYTKFRNYARKLPRIDRPILQPLADGQTMSGQMILFVEAASDFSRELFNSVNDIARSLLTLKAWVQVYEECDLSEQYDLLLEHIRPHSTLALGAPQAIRGRFMYAAAVCCSHANRVLHPDHTELAWSGKGNMNMPIASRVGQPWEKWKKLAPILSEGLSFGAISELTGNFRNATEHGHPRNIGLGLTSSVELSDIEMPGCLKPCGGMSETTKKQAWAVSVREAITLGTVIEVLTEQYALTLKAYELLSELLQDQFNALQTKTHPLPWTIPKHVRPLIDSKRSNSDEGDTTIDDQPA